MICLQCNKEFIPDGRQKICSKECVRQRKRLIDKKYHQSDKYKVYLKSDAKKVSGLNFYHSNKVKINVKRNIYQNERRKTDPLFKLTVNMRGRLNEFLKTKNLKKNNKTFTMVGCTPKFLKKHLEKQFHHHPDTYQPMNWLNHTVHGWHIDHRIPLDSAKSQEDVIKLCHYTNLQPMWAKYNIKKGNKII